MKALVLVNPDNPTGNYIAPHDVIRLIGWTKEKGILLIIDESFIDFAEEGEMRTDDIAGPSLLHNDILMENTHLIVIKSISKSYGVPGLRLGLLACGNAGIVEEVKRKLPIWNINSLGEYFLQIFEKYQGDYRGAMEHFRSVRRKFSEDLKGITQLRVFPSQANFIMCEILDGCSSTQLTEMLLNRYDILIKDLSEKDEFQGKNYIRLAVKSEEENKQLTEAMKHILR